MRLLEEAGLPPGVINMVTGDGKRGLRGRAGRPRPRRHPLHRLDAGLPEPLEAGRREHRVLPVVPADRRRDRRQGLHRRAPVGRPRRAAHRDGPRRLRVPGPEVLGRLARLRAAQPLERRCATTSRRSPTRSRWATSPTCRTSWAPSSTTGRSPSTRRPSTGPRATTPSPSSPAAPATTARAGSSGRPCSSRPTRTTRSSRPSTSARSSACTSTRTATTTTMLAQMESVAPYALTGSIIAQDRAAVAAAQRVPAVRGRQLLRQRQADRRRRRPAAVRRRAGQRHQRQGRRPAEPDALDQHPLDQGDVRPADRPPLPPHGLSPQISSWAGCRSRLEHLDRDVQALIRDRWGE